MKTLLLLAAVAFAAWWYYQRQHPKGAAQARQAADNAATRYAASLRGDERKAQNAVQKMNASIDKSAKAYGDGAQQSH